MTVKEVNGRWHTVSSSGKVGKRAFKSKASAKAAQDRGLALSGQTSSVSSGSAAPGGSIVQEIEDTSVERREKGIPPKAEAKDTGGF